MWRKYDRFPLAVSYFGRRITRGTRNAMQAMKKKKPPDRPNMSPLRTAAKMKKTAERMNNPHPRRSNTRFRSSLIPEASQVNGRWARSPEPMI